MNPNTKIAENIAILATLDPASVAAGTVQTAWVSMAYFMSVMAIIDVGVFGASATVDAKWRQAQDANGTGAKDMVFLSSGLTRAITQLVAAGGNNRQVTLEARDHDLDVNNGYSYVALSVTVGTAATQLCALVLGGNPRFFPAQPYSAASVVQQAG